MYLRARDREPLRIWCHIAPLVRYSLFGTVKSHLRNNDVGQSAEFTSVKSATVDYSKQPYEFTKSIQSDSRTIEILLCPAQWALSDDAVWRLSVWRLSDVCRVDPLSGRRVRPAGWMARIGWSGPARPAWLKTAAVRFRCRPGRGISWWPPAYSLFYVRAERHAKPALAIRTVSGRLSVTRQHGCIGQVDIAKSV